MVLYATGFNLATYKNYQNLLVIFKTLYYKYIKLTLLLNLKKKLALI